MLYEVITRLTFHPAIPNSILIKSSLMKSKLLLMGFVSLFWLCFTASGQQKQVTGVITGENDQPRITSYNVCYTKLLRIPRNSGSISCVQCGSGGGLPCF